MNIKEQLTKMNRFSVSEKELAKYILENKEAVLSMSVQDLSAATYTSTSSVVRMCRKIGLDGFRDFKIQFAAELQKGEKDFDHKVDANFPFEKDDSFYEISEKLYNLCVSALQDTYSKFSIKDFEKAIKLISKAKRTAIFAIGDNNLCARAFQSKMMKINKYVILPTIPGELEQYAYNMTKEDCAIVISYSGENIVLFDAVGILEKQHVPMICITARPQSTIGKKATVLLENCNTESQSIKFGTYSSIVGTEFILNTLYSYLFVSDYDYNSNLRIKSEIYFLDKRK